MLSLRGKLVHKILVKVVTLLSEHDKGSSLSRQWEWVK